MVNKLHPDQARIANFHGFNHSALELSSGGYLVSGRGSDMGNNTLWFGRTREDFSLLWEGVVSIPGTKRLHDPRLFERVGTKVIMACRVGSVHRQAMASILVDEVKGSVEITDFKVLQFPSNRSEKNWIPFAEGFYYDFSKSQRILEDGTFFTPPIASFKFKLLGGTNILALGCGRYITFTHSVERHPITGKRVYRAFATILGVGPNYSVERILEIDLLELQGVLPVPQTSRWAVENIESVVFPMSLHQNISGELYSILVGINDSATAIVNFSKARILDAFGL